VSPPPPKSLPIPGVRARKPGSVPPGVVDVVLDEALGEGGQRALPAGTVPPEPPRLPAGSAPPEPPRPPPGRTLYLLGPGAAPLYSTPMEPPASVVAVLPADDALAPYTPEAARVAARQPLAPLPEPPRILAVSSPASRASMVDVTERLHADIFTAALQQEIDQAERSIIGPLARDTRATMDAIEALAQSRALSVPRIASAMRRIWTAKAAQLGGDAVLYTRIAIPLYQMLAGIVLPHRQMKRCCAVWNSLIRYLGGDPDELELHSHHPIEARVLKYFPQDAARLGWRTENDMPAIAVHYLWHIRAPGKLYPAGERPPPEALSLTWELFKHVDLTKPKGLRQAYLLYRDFYRAPVTEKSTGTKWLLLKPLLDEVGRKLGYTQKQLDALDVATDRKRKRR
jgi:hypothetical protein